MEKQEGQTETVALFDTLRLQSIPKLWGAFSDWLYRATQSQQMSRSSPVSHKLRKEANISEQAFFSLISTPQESEKKFIFPCQKEVQICFSFKPLEADSRAWCSLVEIYYCVPRKFLTFRFTVFRSAKNWYEIFLTFYSVHTEIARIIFLKSDMMHTNDMEVYSIIFSKLIDA